MSQLIIPGTREVAGPWLLKKNAFVELDGIIEIIDKRIEESAETQFNENAQRRQAEHPNMPLETFLKFEKESYSGKKVKKVQLISDSANVLIDTTVKGLLKDQKLSTFKAVELRIDISQANSKFSFHIRKRFDGPAGYEVSSSDQSVQEDIIYQIDSWLDKYKPIKASQIWNTQAFWLGSLGIMFIFWSFLALGADVVDVKPIYANEISKILKVGVNKENHDKAIELLLKYVTEYQSVHKEYHAFDNKLFVGLLVAGIFSFFIANVKPKTTIGIGANETMVRVYTWYTKAILVTIPAAIILGPLWKAISKYLLGV